MVFVLDKRKKPLMPCSNKRASELLDKGRARVHKVVPFTIRLVDRLVEDSELQPMKIKIDPGSKITGVALTREDKDVTTAVKLIELEHRGWEISKKLEQRKGHRRRRRSKLRYRKSRFLNRRTPKGWLAPSVKHRVDSTERLVDKLIKLAPVTNLSLENVKFDTQKMENPEISGVEYQQGELQGYEVKEYLLEKWGRKCVYCGKTDVPLQVDHIHPKSKGGSNRVSNLTLACVKCNQKKGNKLLEEFKPELSDLLNKAKKPLKDAGIMNSIRNKIVEVLSKKLPLELASGAMTKFNRDKLGLPKSHCLDALCVGKIKYVRDWNQPVLRIKCMGRGKYQRTNLNKYGFPISYSARKKSFKGFQTGDICHAVVTKGKKIGEYFGRISIRQNGSFNIQSKNLLVSDINYQYFSLVQRSDGYRYLLQ